MTRYRTPRKKTTDWKGHLFAFALGVVGLTLGLILLNNPPRAPEEEGQAVTGEAAEATSTAVPEDPAEGEPAGDEPPQGPRPDASAELARSFFGLALVVLGVALPVASIVIERTSGKKWNRRAGKKHPFKRKI